MKDLYSNLGVVASLVPAVQTATLKGTGIDLQGFNGAMMIVNTGAIAGAGDYGLAMQHSADDVDGNYTNVTAADLQGSLPATLEASTIYKQGYVGSKRWLRAVITKGSGTSIAAGAVFVKGHPAIAPVA